MRHVGQLNLLKATSLCVGLSLASGASANDRKFTYTYETAVLPEGGRELEVWTTWRAGRDHYYSRFDHRLEFEVGLTDRLMTAFYLNFTGLTEQDDAGVRTSAFEYKGVSSEWKLKLTDPVADPIGFGLYGEVSVAPSEYELEAKALLDKQVGDVLFAFNVVGEAEFEVEQDEVEKEFVVKPVVGVSYRVTPCFSMGLEVVEENVIEEGELEHAVLSAGPVLSFSRESWWATMTFLPQVVDFTSGERDIESHEMFQYRLLFSAHL